MHLLATVVSRGIVMLSGGAIIDLDSTYFFQLAIFLALFGILYTVLFKPMAALFDERDRAIDGAKDRAKDLVHDADEKYKHFETEMKRVKLEAAAERDRVRQDGLLLERELLSKSRVEAEAMAADAQKQLAEQAAVTRREMQASTTALAQTIAEKLLGRKAS